MGPRGRRSRLAAPERPIEVRLTADSEAGPERDAALTRARFGPGELVHHQKFGYRGVVVDVDAVFSGSDEWYDQVARSRPPKDRPWYHVLVHDADHMTYVAERHLEPDQTGEPVRHPLLEAFFDELQDGHYRRPDQSLN